MGLFFDIAFLAGDVAIAGILYQCIKSNQKEINAIENAPEVSIDNKLSTMVASSENQELPYVCVEGRVAAETDSLKSRHTDITGVIQTSKMYELKSKRTQGFWHDDKVLIHDTVSTVPFVLTNSNENITRNSCKIHVNDPTLSKYLMENLHETYNKFEQNSNNAITRGIDRIFGDVTKGFEKTETMLPIGSTLLGMGKLALDRGQLILKCPDIDAPYIVTLLTRNDVVKSIRSQSTMLKFFLGVFATVGIGFLYVMMKHIRGKLEAYRLSRAAEAYYRQRRDEHGDGDVLENIENLCVICLTAQRGVVLLDCGHICLCEECSVSLPEPIHCPICRGRVVRMLPVYVP